MSIRELVATATVVLSLAGGRLGAQDAGIAVGASAPGAAVEQLDGTAINLSQYLGKQPALIEFWATWCPNCKALEPQIEAAVKKYGTKMKFVAVAVSVNQSVARVKAYKEKHGITSDIVWDGKGYAADAYEVPATSYIVVVNAQGKVVYTGVGADQDIEAAIRKAL